MQNIIDSFVSMMYDFVKALDLTSPMRVLILIADIVIVSLIIYYFYRFIKQTRAQHIFKGMLLLIGLLIIAKLFNMVILNFILTNFLTYGMLLLIVVFQPELRNVFEKIGRSKIVDVFDMDDNILVKHSIGEIVKAVEIMSLKQIGALIVIEKNTKIQDALKEGIPLSAKVSSELIQNIFMPRTPLHDGAIIIDKTQILAAKCILPLASEVTVPKSLGTRHRAAVGITEISDALVIVVSEETGIISLAESGKLTRNLSGDELKALLLKKLDRTKNASMIKNIVKKDDNKEE
ncbi:MAG: diadenylate cyclase CdaA [Clostridia bacterium]|nr:diadenylate cyclase CdaA [Clostridia bacterium]